MTEETKKARRPTVNVVCGVKQGVLMRVVKPESETEAEWPSRVDLKEGSNPGVDKAFWAAWLAENPSLSIVANRMIYSLPEKDPPAEPEVEQQQDGAGTVPPEAVRDEPGDPTPQVMPHSPANP